MSTAVQHNTPKINIHRKAGIYYESFNLMNFVNCIAFLKTKASIYFCIRILCTLLSNTVIALRDHVTRTTPSYFDQLVRVEPVPNPNPNFWVQCNLLVIRIGPFQCKATPIGLLVSHYQIKILACGRAGRLLLLLS